MGGEGRVNNDEENKDQQMVRTVAEYHHHHHGASPLSPRTPPCASISWDPCKGMGGVQRRPTGKVASEQRVKTHTHQISKAQTKVNLVPERNVGGGHHG